MTHSCHAIGCGVAVQPKLLFCFRHWSLLPRQWRTQVWNTYRPGQEKGKNPSGEYLLVQAVCVALVAVREGVWSRDQGERHIAARGELVWTHLSRDFVRTLPEIVWP